MKTKELNIFLLFQRMDNYIHLTAFENIQTRSETQLLVHRIAHAQLHRKNQVNRIQDVVGL
jgi:predicted amidohydrolase YtcJ